MGKRKTFNADTELRSRNSKEAWCREDYRHKISIARAKTKKEKWKNFPWISCLNCKIDFQCQPSRKDTRKYCSRICRIAALTNTPNLKNRGKKSSARSGSGISGSFKGNLFRSTYELSFMINVVEARKLSLRYEPFVIKLANGRHYVPDFVSDDKIIYEIKYENAFKQPKIKQKLTLVREWCCDNGYRLMIFTENDMKILSVDEIIELVKAGSVILFPKKNMGVRLRRLLEKLNVSL